MPLCREHSLIFITRARRRAGFPRVMCMCIYCWESCEFVFPGVTAGICVLVVDDGKSWGDEILRFGCICNAVF